MFYTYKILAAGESNIPTIVTMDYPIEKDGGTLIAHDESEFKRLAYVAPREYRVVLLLSKETVH